jgi:hypothetical protein
VPLFLVVKNASWTASAADSLGLLVPGTLRFLEGSLGLRLQYLLALLPPGELLLVVAEVFEVLEIGRTCSLDVAEILPSATAPFSQAPSRTLSPSCAQMLSAMPDPQTYFPFLGVR